MPRKRQVSWKKCEYIDTNEAERNARPETNDIRRLSDFNAVRGEKSKNGLLGAEVENLGKVVQIRTYPFPSSSTKLSPQTAIGNLSGTLLPSRSVPLLGLTERANDVTPYRSGYSYGSRRRLVNSKIVGIYE